MDFVTAMEDRQMKRDYIDSVALCHVLKAIEIVGTANQHRLLGYSLDYDYSELSKECSIISTLHSWSIREPLTDEEKAEDRAQFESCTEEEKKVYKFLVEEYEPDQAVNRFINIMKMDPKDITADMKIEVFELFPYVIGQLELRGGF